MLQRTAKSSGSWDEKNAVTVLRTILQALCPSAGDFWDVPLILLGEWFQCYFISITPRSNIPLCYWRLNSLKKNSPPRKGSYEVIKLSMLVSNLQSFCLIPSEGWDCRHISPLRPRSNFLSILPVATQYKKDVGLQIPQWMWYPCSFHGTDLKSLFSTVFMYPCRLPFHSFILNLQKIKDFNMVLSTSDTFKRDC